MANKTPIEWTDATWNPITGCTLVSDGCKNCYAAHLAATRLKNHSSREGLAKMNADGVAKFTGEVRFNEQWLEQPLHWKKPRMIFVCAHADLFHENVPDEWIDKIFAVMALCPQHTFQVLTKRPNRMREYLTDKRANPVALEALGIVIESYARDGKSKLGRGIKMNALQTDEPYLQDWPLPNVWLGTSVENQATAEQRIPALLETPAAIRFISAEPLLGPIDFDMDMLWYEKCTEYCEYAYVEPDTNEFVCSRCDSTGITGDVGIDWVIVGGESGKKARPMHPDWARQIRDQCAAAHVRFLFKQWGQWAPWDDDNWSLPDGWDEVSWRENRCRKIDGIEFIDVGKKKSGRTLDGKLHDGFPQIGGA